jgi:alpha-D-ribose 1-methylphosphonate 5-triphosphate synthase subunit PhnH
MMVHENSSDSGFLLTQRAFREVMDAMARPGLIHRIPPADNPTLDNPYLETLVVMLCDSGCRFSVAAQQPDVLAMDVAMRSYATPVPPEDAQFALVTADASRDEGSALLGRLSGGSLISPERGATVLFECDGLFLADGAAAPYTFVVRGPGVCGSRAFCASSDAWFEARAGRDDEFPCGIDLILVDRYGAIIGIPRTTLVEPVLPPAGQASSSESALSLVGRVPAPESALPPAGQALVSGQPVSLLGQPTSVLPGDALSQTAETGMGGDGTWPTLR